MFGLHEKVVYPGHGVAEVNRIIEKQVGGKITKFFELKLIRDKTTVLVPIYNLKGLRKLITKKEIDTIVLKILSQEIEKNENEFKLAVVASSWARRNKQYQAEIISGDITKLIKIYKILKKRSLERDLSFGERHLLQQAEFLLVQEIAFVENINEDLAKEKVLSCLNCDECIVKPSKKVEL